MFVSPYAKTQNLGSILWSLDCRHYLVLKKLEASNSLSSYISIKNPALSNKLRKLN